MRPRPTTHMLYEWMDKDGFYFSHIVHRQDSLHAFPGILDARKNGIIVHTTPVRYNQFRECWTLFNGGKLVLPYKVQL